MLIAKRKDIIPFVPHVMFDAILGTPEGYSNSFVLEWELYIIDRCDGICLPTPMTPCDRPCGTLWERAYTRHAGKPVYDYDELLEGKEE